MEQDAKWVIYLFVLTFYWAVMGNMAMFTQNYLAGKASGEIHYVPQCEWLARNFLGSIQGGAPTFRAWQEMTVEMNRCNKQYDTRQSS